MSGAADAETWVAGQAWQLGLTSSMVVMRTLTSWPTYSSTGMDCARAPLSAQPTQLQPCPAVPGSTCMAWQSSGGLASRAAGLCLVHIAVRDEAIYAHEDHVEAVVARHALDTGGQRCARVSALREPLPPDLRLRRSGGASAPRARRESCSQAQPAAGARLQLFQGEEHGAVRKLGVHHELALHARPQDGRGLRGAALSAPRGLSQAQGCAKGGRRTLTPLQCVSSPAWQ